jgi:methane/ammonia monooxygenase subunit C
MSISDITGRAERAKSRFDRKPLLFGIGGLSVFYFLIVLYEHAFGWRAGLDSFAPEFQSYWTSVLEIGIPLWFVSAFGLFGYLWRSRDRQLAEIEPATEMARIFTLVQWLVVFAFALYWALSFFTEQTGVWHMSTIRDTDFTPSNIVTFYVAYPIFAIIGFGALLYARTRIPFFAKGASLPFVIFVVGTFMMIPNVGFNEWGHTSWSMEEGFASPVHWGFAFFAWMSLGAFGVVLQILGRIRVLVGPEGVDAILQR